MDMLLVSTVVSIVGAIVALCLSKAENTAKVVACLFGIVAACCSIIAGATGIFGAEQFICFATPFNFANFTLLINPLSGLLLVAINILALVAWIYGLAYFDEYKGMGLGAIGFFMNLFVASMNMVLTVDNAFWFLVFFELMSLTSYFLVIVEQKPQSIKGGFLYFIMAHVGFFMIMLSYLIMAANTGSFEFATFRATQFSPAIASLCFILAFCGFGCKAGMFPFHSWLPQAHPAAPSNVSALMSGGMIKIGIFGIVKVGLDLLGSCEVQLWWGLVILVIGALSSVLGVAYALGEHDIKKLLAYHSVENIGIILLGIAIGYMGMALNQPVIAVLGIMAGLYHVLNHAMFKGLLFLGAGSVLYTTGSRNMEIMGGLARVMPATAMCFLIGSLAISAIPPLNGFVSEWFIYQSMFSVAITGDIIVRFFAAFAAVSLAITGALAVTCFVKAYGVTFLGAPRSEAAANAKEVPASMRIGMIILAVMCICLGIGAPWVAPVMQNIAAATTGQATIAVASGLDIANPAIGSVVSTPMLAILLIACVLVPVAARSLFSKGGVASDRDPWACGYALDPEMPVVATTFAAEVKMFLKPIYAAREAVVSTAGSFQAMFGNVVSGAAKAETVGDKYVVAGTASFVNWISKQVQKIEGGNFRVYIIYIVVALVFFLTLAVLMK
ncbi:hydrogenase 4 subunit B [uncultured Slackia sp.]|uniref:hydrogenase 4 subunit B n=1 Tax=uncultured Slackia sp. TaxID=665903 RepID=UPI0025E535B4|nr:hydrogenase 4 subunit B [uncultured Slackia sp.]